LGTNCIGHYLFAETLAPLLTKTASTEPAGSVRTVWVASSGINYAPKGGIDFDDINGVKGPNKWLLYGQSKVGDVYLATEFGKKYKDIVSVVCYSRRPFCLLTSSL
jgi:retinol dehydrogenase-12